MLNEQGTAALSEWLVAAEAEGVDANFCACAVRVAEGLLIRLWGLVAKTKTGTKLFVFAVCGAKNKPFPVVLCKFL